MNDRNVQKLTSRLCDTSADVVFFPVRHHSPAAAKLVEQLIAEIKPSSVLIEGPADFNEHIDELFLGHELPISIYSYFQSSAVDSVSGETDTSQHGAFYPFCEYSPEWVALQVAQQNGIEARFIDLPWAEVAFADQATHRYADAELRYGRYVQLLCERLQAEGLMTCGIGWLSPKSNLRWRTIWSACIRCALTRDFGSKRFVSPIKSARRTWSRGLRRR